MADRIYTFLGYLQPPSNLHTLFAIVATWIALNISALFIWHKQPWLRRVDMTPTISDRILNWCTNTPSVSDLLAEDPSLAPGKAAEKIFGRKFANVEGKKWPEHREKASAEELEKAYRCGKFGPTKPSELFLRIYHDALLPLEHDPLAGCVSPSLMGSCGAVPLSIIGPLPDIIRHMSNLIARAEKEVFLATNYWMDSDATRLITDAIRELSKRAQGRGSKAVVKILYDRGSIRQVVQNHYTVPVKEYTGEKVRLPHPDELPGIDMEVVNFHRPAVGTFHSKFMVVDRKYGVLSSNNIQDNDNVEMGVCLEGPIIDSLYDVCLLSWHNALNPPLPSHATPAARGGLPTFNDPSFHGLFDQDGTLKVPEGGSARSLDQVDQVVKDGNEHERLPMHLPGDPHYDDNVAGEITRMQASLTPSQPGGTYQPLYTQHLNRATKQDRKGDAPEPQPGEEMATYVPHSVHKPVPIALVNRKPWGAPNHSGSWMPQNEAWLSAVRNAEHTIFIQTPDLNADLLLPELVAACKRGVEVTYYVSLGYNDAGELLPFQGGTNEMVASRLYSELRGAEKKRLHVGYYVGKDQTRPIHNKFKSRSCHIKLMVVDGHIGIQGNGNQDTQSWYHSQEVNILIDSAEICGAWMDGIRRNQNTHLYGMASQEDGIWRDENGNEADGAIGKDPGRFSWAKGITGAIARVRGAGGF